DAAVQGDVDAEGQESHGVLRSRCGRVAGREGFDRFDSQQLPALSEPTDGRRVEMGREGSTFALRSLSLPINSCRSFGEICGGVHFRGKAAEMGREGLEPPILLRSVSAS